ncbi:MAG TPA: hypothetical protein VFH18_00820 [Erysipelotrichaceae bacterium]|nr:hypothetical protein [Erysipelotrichaceae bacterium]
MSPTGHLAIGFAVKRWYSKLPLIWYLIGANIIDIIYIVLTVLGIESFGNNPWTHSLLMAVIYANVGGLLTYVISRQRNSSILMGIVIFSHWLLDFIVWDNLPIAFGKTPLLGLGLYNMIGFNINAIQFNTGLIIATSIELILFIIGVYLYIKSKKLRKVL